MEEEMKEFKVTIRSLLTISQKPLSVHQLNIDYKALEGKPIPYRKFGFYSLIELLQNLKDIASLPENPNQDSIVSSVVSNKTHHIRMMVVKQKSPKTKGKHKSCNNNNSSHKSSTNGICHELNKKYNRQSNGNNYVHKYNTSPKNQCQNEMYHTGYVTKELRHYLERTILYNNKSITVDQLKKLVKEHQDFLHLKAKNMEDVMRLLNFLEVKGTNVVLKSTAIIKSHNGGSLTNGYNDDKLNNSSSNLKLSTNNSPNKNTFYSSNTYADLEIADVTDLLSKLTCNNQEDIKNKPNALTTQSEKLHIKLNEIENKFQGVSDVSANNLNTLFCHSTEKKNKCDVKITKNDALSMYKNQHIPPEVLLNITRIFSVYNKGLNIDNFKLLYNILYDTFLDSTTYGFETIVQLFKVLDQIIEVRNNVFFTKSENKLKDHINFKGPNALEKKQKNVNRILSEVELDDISLNVQQKLLSSDQNSSKTKMVLSEAYNPSLFYLHTYSDDVKLTYLMDQMKLFYDEDNLNYVVKSNHIFVGLIYVSSYTSFANKKQWFRVRVLEEVDSAIIKVIKVDYGTIDFIQKTKLKFLKKEFSYLPCQAIHCCLAYYNELHSIKQEGTFKFLELINKKPFLVQVNDQFLFDSYCESYQILHVNLFQQIDESDNYIHINNELSIFLKK